MASGQDWCVLPSPDASKASWFREDLPHIEDMSHRKHSAERVDEVVVPSH